MSRIDLRPHKDALTRRTVIVWVGLVVVAIVAFVAMKLALLSATGDVAAIVSRTLGGAK